MILRYVMVLCTLICITTSIIQSVTSPHQKDLTCALKDLSKQDKKALHAYTLQVKNLLEEKNKSSFELSIPGAIAGLTSGLFSYCAIVCCIGYVWCTWECFKHSREKVKNKINSYLQRQERLNVTIEHDSPNGIPRTDYEEVIPQPGEGNETYD